MQAEVQLPRLPRPSRTEDVDVSLIDSSRFQPRQTIYRKQDKQADEMLAHSMQQDGLFHDLWVSLKQDRRFELIFGHRRLAAAKKLGWKKISCQVYENVPDITLAYVVGTENFQRVQIRPYEKGKYFFALKSFMNVEQMSRLFGIPSRTIMGWMQEASAWDKLMTGLSEQQQESFVQKITIRIEKSLLKLAEIEGSEKEVKTAILMVLQDKDMHDKEVEIEEYVNAAVNALTRLGHKSEGKVETERRKKMTHQELEKEIDSLIVKAKRVETIEDLPQVLEPLVDAFRVYGNKSREYEAKMGEYMRLMKGSKSLKIKNTEVRVAHKLEKDAGVGHCWHELPNGEKVCINFAL